MVLDDESVLTATHLMSNKKCFLESRLNKILKLGTYKRRNMCVNVLLSGTGVL